MLGDITIASELYIVCGYTDMRKSIDGLCTIIRDQLHMEPGHSSALYLFCGKRCDRIKAILHESDGFVLLYKRLDAHVGRYQWPRSRNGIMVPVTVNVDLEPMLRFQDAYLEQAWTLMMPTH